MNLSACPNCSGYLDDPGTWVIGRPQLVTGKRSKKVFISGCCAFSNRSSRIYNTEEEAAAVWELFRAKASAGNPRLLAMLAALNEYEARLYALPISATVTKLLPASPQLADAPQQTLL